jgi:hypothetical protein
VRGVLHTVATKQDAEDMFTDTGNVMGARKYIDWKKMRNEYDVVYLPDDVPSSVFMLKDLQRGIYRVAYG